MIRFFNLFVIVMAVMALVSSASPARAQVADPTYYSTYAGIQLDGRQCVPTCRDIAWWLLNKRLPFLGANGVAAQMWGAVGPEWRKTPNNGTNLPGWFAVVCFGPNIANGQGHLAMCVGIKDRATRTIWLLDSNWFHPNGWPRGALHSVRVDGNVIGWLD